MSAEDWHWVNLQGGFSEQLVADLCDGSREDTALGRGCIVIQTNATSSFHVSFSQSSSVPFRNTQEPVLRFVVGKRQNSMTSVGLGNPYLKKEPIDFTKHPDALLSTDESKSRTYWFLYDRVVGVAAMGVQASPQADLCRLVSRFRDSVGFRSEICENLRYVSVSAGKRPISLRVVRVGSPPDLSIPRFRFNPVDWCELPWNGNSCVFLLDELHKQLVMRAQKLLASSPIAPFYGLVQPDCFCLNAYRLLDPLRKPELFPGYDVDEVDWSTCHDEVYRRVAPVLQSASWTFWPLKFEKADCTTITLSASGAGCARVVSEWCKALHDSTGLRNAATNREMLTLPFAFEVFPVEGENIAQVRRDLVKEITSLLKEEWGIMEFHSPHFACWQTHTRSKNYIDLNDADRQYWSK